MSSMSMIRLTCLLLFIVSIVRCQDASAPTSLGASIDPSSIAYQCDSTKCTIGNNCQCASLSPPGGLKPADVPQFITITLDDAIQTYTIDAVQSLVGNRVNPNGCPPKLTFFTSLNYTNFSLVTTWYSTGNDVADHTMTHVGNPPENEIAGNMIALNALAGIPFREIRGFRAPFLNYTPETLQTLKKLNLTYDSSMTANSDGKRGPGVPTDRTWPYTLDYGSVHDCENPGICGPNGVRIPGLWEIPMMVMYGRYFTCKCSRLTIRPIWQSKSNGSIPRPRHQHRSEYAQDYLFRSVQWQQSSNGTLSASYSSSSELSRPSVA